MTVTVSEPAAAIRPCAGSAARDMVCEFSCRLYCSTITKWHEALSQPRVTPVEWTHQSVVSSLLSVTVHDVREDIERGRAIEQVTRKHGL